MPLVRTPHRRTSTLSTSTLSTSSTVTLSDEGCNAFMRALCRDLAEARQAVLAAHEARLVGQTLPHPDMNGVLCTVVRMEVDEENIVNVVCTFTNSTGEVEFVWLDL